jgi:hypothetical protein
MYPLPNIKKKILRAKRSLGTCQTSWRINIYEMASPAQCLGYKEKERDVVQEIFLDAAPVITLHCKHNKKFKNCTLH